ncbi:MAG TPA: hypothetical protein VFO36_07855, partial [Nitrospiraceae bacterium]|nr:hypothetical protein [Nitrospiraceae bacterium]
ELMASSWTLRINAALGSLVIAMGAWLAWEGLAGVGGLMILVIAGCFLVWRGRTLRLIWAWTTLFLGIECLAWPIITMLRIRSATTQPSDEQMGTILSAVLMGLFSAVFWIAFSYGLFKGTDPNRLPQSPETQSPRRQKKR